MKAAGMGLLTALGLLAALGLAGCDEPDSGLIQGYVEGEFVYVSSSLPGTLETLSVSRGDAVTSGAKLFDLDDTPDKAACEEAEGRLAQARASLEDARKGKRPSEIAAIEAEVAQAQVALNLAEVEYRRQEKLMNEGKGATSEQALDRALSERNQAQQSVARLEAELTTAKLGQRAGQIAAAEENVKALEAALVQAEWNLDQKHQSAPSAGLVFDTLYRPGEWVAAGRPVVSLLPPGNIKVRAFVPEPRIGAVKVGDPVRVHVDGVSGRLDGKVNFVSPEAEFTPPVIYSRESRRKLVFMIEIVFDPDTATTLHPGQPVDVDLAPESSPAAPPPPES